MKNFPSFKQFLSETIAISDINKRKGKKPVTLFIGRIQPPTKLHIKIITDAYKKYKQPVVINLVKGKKTDKNKNPFPLEIQEKILKQCLTIPFEIKITQTGFIGEVVDQLRNENKEPTVLMCGSDRVKGYEKQIERYKDEIGWDIKVVEIKRNDEDVSATKVRQSLKDNDYEIFKKNMDKCSWKMFDELKKFV